MSGNNIITGTVQLGIYITNPIQSRENLQQSQQEQSQDFGLEVLDKVNNFYTSQMSTLMRIMGIFITLIGIILPIFIGRWNNNKLNKEKDDIFKEINKKSKEWNDKMTKREILINEKIDKNIMEIELTTSYSTLITRAVVSIMGESFQQALLESLSALGGGVAIYIHEFKNNNKKPFHILDQSIDTITSCIGHIQQNKIDINPKHDPEYTKTLNQLNENILQYIEDENTTIPLQYAIKIKNIATTIKTLI